MLKSSTTRPHKKLYQPGEVDSLENYIWGQGRDSFPVFRQLVHPELIWGWWVEEISWELQDFYDELIAGRRPRRALMAPPQHGKSSAVTDFLAWVAGKSPYLGSVFASYSAELGERTNLSIQRIMQSTPYRRMFPHMSRVGEHGWVCNSTLIEFPGYKGSFRNTTVEGQITGFGLNLGVIDDPVKGRKEANSKTIRDSTWSWYTDDFFLRFHKDAGQLIIMTRWHIDDLLGRALEQMNFKVHRYPAVAEENEKYRKKGEALFPEWKPLDFLYERKQVLTEGSWLSLYQQTPILVGGGAIPIEKLTVIPRLDRNQIRHSVRYWDKAGTDDTDAAFTAGVLMHLLDDGRYLIEHVVRGQWQALDRETIIKNTCTADAATYHSYEVVVEQEPGSGGKESAESTIRNLAGLRVTADKVTGAKEVRNEPFVAQCQGGNVMLVAGEWVNEFLDEAEVWPQGRRKDQIDAAGGAFNKVCSQTVYDTSYSGFE